MVIRISCSFAQVTVIASAMIMFSEFSSSTLRGSMEISLIFYASSTDYGYYDGVNGDSLQSRFSMDRFESRSRSCSIKNGELHAKRRSAAVAHNSTFFIVAFGLFYSFVRL